MNQFMKVLFQKFYAIRAVQVLLFTVLLFINRFVLFKIIRYGFFRFKDVMLKEVNSYFVYKFMFSCCNAIYFGKSETHSYISRVEHLGIAPLTRKRVKKPKKLPIIYHLS